MLLGGRSVGRCCLEFLNFPVNAMKKFGLSALVLCLALVGLLAIRDGAFVVPSISTFVTDAVSADNLPVTIDGAWMAVVSEADLAAGEQMFEQECTLCHSAPLVFKSHVLAGDVDTLVVTMLRKDQIVLAEQDSRLLVAYLKTRLPIK